MEWWTGMGSCGSGSVAEMSQIEAGIFDPWINCDDLDLGTILHQANVSNASSSSAASANSSGCSPLSAQSLLLSHAVNSTNGTGANSSGQQVQTSSSPGGLLISDSAHDSQLISNNSSNNNDRLQNYGFVCNGNANGVVLNQVHQHHHQQQQQQQQQHHQQQQHLSSTSNNIGSKNFFDIINSAALSSTNNHHHHHHLHQQQHQQVSNNQAPPPTSVSSSQCSSAVSTAGSLSSLDSSPQNNQINSYLQSPTSSSPTLIPTSAVATIGHSLLMIDSEDNKQILHQQTLNQHLHNHHHNHHHHGYLAAQLHRREEQPSELQQSQNSINHQQAQSNDSSSNAILDSKANMENLLHLTSGHCEQTRTINTTRELQFALESQNDSYSHLLFTCPAQSSSTAITTSNESTANNNSSFTSSVSSSCINQSSSSSSSLQRTSTVSNNSNLVSKSKSYSAIGVSAKASSTTSTTSSLSSSSASSNHSSNGQTTIQAIGSQKVRRCRHITDYVLADEEKRLLIKEGYTDFPMTCQSRPLSKTEERILRKIRRKIRNKKSAQCSRQRKKEYVEDLERKYAVVVRENEELKQVLDKIQQQQLALVQQSDGGPSTIALDWKDLFVRPVKQHANSTGVYSG